MITFTPIEISEIDETEFNTFSDKLIYQTLEWIEFIKETQHAEPVVLRITDGDKFIGYFTGLLFKRFGINIIGSPFNGWTTEYMGFNISDDIDVNRAELIAPLWTFLKKKYHCLICQITDRYITADDIKKYNLIAESGRALILDISGSDEDLLSTYTKHCRKHIRAFEKNPVSIFATEPDEEFAEGFYEQLKQVFAYQGLSPSYDLKRVKTLLRLLSEKNEVLCTKVVETETGRWRSSAISFGFNGRAYTWATTTLRDGPDYRQSEGQRWFAIRYWRDHGCKELDMVGMREYKLKFNPDFIPIHTVILPSSKLFIRGKQIALKLYWLINKIKLK